MDDFWKLSLYYADLGNDNTTGKDQYFKLEAIANDLGLIWTTDGEWMSEDMVRKLYKNHRGVIESELIKRRLKDGHN